VTRTLVSRSNCQRSRSPGRFTHRSLNAWGRCSGDRENVLGVRNYCYVASAGRRVRRWGDHREGEGRGIYRVATRTACYTDELQFYLWYWATGITWLMRGLATLPKVIKSLQLSRQGWKSPGELGGKQVHRLWYILPLVLWHCWFGDIKGIRPVKNVWVTLCWWWRFDRSFLHVSSLQLSPLTTSIILSSSKIQNGDILVPASDILVLKLISVLVLFYSLVRIFILFSFSFLDQW